MEPELQAAIDRITPFVDATFPDLDDDLATVMEAVRLVANPNIEVARDSVDLAGVTLLLWRIMELMGVGVAEFPKKDRTGFAMMIRDSIVNEGLFAAAFTQGDTDEPT